MMIAPLLASTVASTPVQPEAAYLAAAQQHVDTAMGFGAQKLGVGIAVNENAADCKQREGSKHETLK